MPTPAGAPLRKVTLNLYEEDCIALETGHGRGWSEVVREWVHEKSWSYRKHMPKPEQDDDTTFQRLTLGDLK